MHSIMLNLAVLSQTNILPYLEAVLCTNYVSMATKMLIIVVICNHQSLEPQTGRTHSYLARRNSLLKAKICPTFTG